jgi:hypothetical protein
VFILTIKKVLLRKLLSEAISVPNLQSFLPTALASETHLAEGQLSPTDGTMHIENSLLHRAGAQR